MPTEYLECNCKTCGATLCTPAANAPTQEGKYLLRCTSEPAHQHTYDAEEIGSRQLEASPEIRTKMGLD